MCGRFALYAEKEQLADTFLENGSAEHLESLDAWKPTYTISPTATIPVVTAGDSVRELDLAQWGWERPWLKRPLFNATAEKLLNGPTWKKAFARSRALVPMNGYFEWVDEPPGQQPYYISGSGLLAAAALVDHREDKDFVTIVTTIGVDAAGSVHDRMPVFLEPDLWDEWLTSGAAADELALLRNQALGSSESMAKDLHVWPVTRKLNNSRTAWHEGQKLIEPVELEDLD